MDEPRISSSRKRASSQPQQANPDAGRSTAGAIYERQGMGQRIGFGQRPALLVIDMQNDFCDPDAPTTLYPSIRATYDPILRLSRLSRPPLLPGLPRLPLLPLLPVLPRFPAG